MLIPVQYMTIIIYGLLWPFWIMEEMMNYLTSAEIANIWNISQRRVQIYCKEGRIKGAVLVGNRWLLPKNAVKPVDPRKSKKNETNK